VSDQTKNLALPYILPSQAQKHVTHNEALQRLDAIVQLSIAGEPSLPPSDASEGQCYLVAEGAGGAWSGKDGMLALRQDGAWIYIEPKTGWRAFFMTQGQLRALSNDAWRAISLDDDGSVPVIGVNTSPDAVNRVSVASDASLFTHSGTGHQLKVNKSATAETGTLLFQTAWSGRAEMGLTGSDEFSVGQRRRQRLADCSDNFTPRCRENSSKADRAGVLGRRNIHTGIRQPNRFLRFSCAAGRFHPRPGRSVRRRRSPAYSGDRSLHPAAGSKHIIFLRARGSGRSKRHNGTCIRCWPGFGWRGAPYCVRAGVTD